MHCLRRMLEPGWCAVIPNKLASSRLSSELGCELFDVDWGQTRAKPPVLHLWGGTVGRTDLPTRLEANGH